MYIQITTRCNMHCEHCCYSCGKRGHDMSAETYAAALAYGDEYLSIGGGEPTLHPLFWQFLGQAIAAAETVWLATNGSQTEIALALAKLARKGVIGCALSQDCYHDEIDDRVVDAFTREPRPYDYIGRGDAADGREIRDVTGKEIKAGRCRHGSDDCPCSDLIVKPDGRVFACGCKRAPCFGNITGTVTIPDNWEVGECYRQQSAAQAA